MRSAVVASRPRGNIRAGGLLALMLVLTLTLMVLMRVLMMVKGEVVSIRGGKWTCGSAVRCKRVVWCLLLRFGRSGAR